MEPIRPLTRRTPGVAARVREIDPPQLFDPAEREAQRKERERRRQERARRSEDAGHGSGNAERRSGDRATPPRDGAGGLDVRG
jgi:hypothetical protein